MVSTMTWLPTSDPAQPGLIQNVRRPDVVRTPISGSDGLEQGDRKEDGDNHTDQEDREPDPDLTGRVRTLWCGPSRSLGFVRVLLG